MPSFEEPHFDILADAFSDLYVILLPSLDFEMGKVCL